MVNETLKQWIQESDNIVFFGGAGVSTESGIPDFRSETGIYSTMSEFGYRPERILSHTFFMQNTDVFYKYYRSKMLYPDAQPNAAHIALAALEKMGKLKAVVTQNIDNLHQQAGSKTVYELHGSCYRNLCMRCGARYDGIEIVLSQQGVPTCPKCGGTIKPDVVLYEEALDDGCINRAVDAIAAAQMLIIAGTSLSVYPAAGLVQFYKGKRLVLINKSSTGYDNKADLLIQQSVGEVLGDTVQAILQA